MKYLFPGHGNFLLEGRKEEPFEKRLRQPVCYPSCEPLLRLGGGIESTAFGAVDNLEPFFFYGLVLKRYGIAAFCMEVGSRQEFQFCCIPKCMCSLSLASRSSALTVQNQLCVIAAHL